MLTIINDVGLDLINCLMTFNLKVTSNFEEINDWNSKLFIVKSYLIVGRCLVSYRNFNTWLEMMIIFFSYLNFIWAKDNWDHEVELIN